MYIPFLIIMGYMVLLVVIAVLSNQYFRKKGSAAEFLLAGKSLPTFLVMAMVAGTAIGGTGTLGISENAYTNGLSAMWYNIAWALGILFFAFAVSRKLKQTNITTTSQIFIQLFSRFDGAVSCMVQIVILFCINALQAIAGGAILAAILPHFFTLESGIVVSSVIFVAIALLGGYFGATTTNALNVFMIYLGVIVGCVAAVSHYGGMPQIVSSLPVGDQWFNLVKGMGPALIAGWVISMVVQAPPNQGLIQATSAAKDSKSANRGLIIAAVLLVPIGFFCALIGIIAAAELPGLASAKTAFPSLMSSLNPWVAGFALAGLWSADVSTATSMILGVSAVATRDVIVRIFRPDMTDKNQLIASKIIILLCGVFGALAALNISSILGFMMKIIIVFVPYSYLLLCALYCPKLIRKSSCTVTVLTNLAVMAMWLIFPATHIVSDMIYLCLPATLVAAAVCILFDKRPVDTSVMYTGI